MLVDLIHQLVRRFKSVLNVAGRLIYNLRSFDHISDALISLLWLRVPEQIELKIATLTYKLLPGGEPTYLVEIVRIADLTGRRSLLTLTIS